MDISKIKKLIGQDTTPVNNYLAYLSELETKKKKVNNQWVIANPWMEKRTPEYLARIYKAVTEDHLIFDGIDVTLQSTGVSYSYQAYKNRMLYVYPESIVDVSLVYNGDEFSFKKESGKVIYRHNIANPFTQTEDQIIGGYCVIKNKRGEFLTTLTREDIEKHRKVAKTDFIWAKWFVEMAMKTIIKKACKTHFKDSFTTIERFDNENYDLDKIEPYITPEQATILNRLIEVKKVDLDKFLKHFEIESVDKIKTAEYDTIKTALEAK